MTDKDELRRRFEDVERLSCGSAGARALSRPIKYARFILINKIIYKVFGRSFTVKARPFFGGAMWVELPAGTDIFLTGGKTHESELRLAKFLLRRLSDGNTFFDIGAHFGYFTLLAQALVGSSGAVYAFEPALLNRRLLQKNAGNRQGITLSNKALSAAAGTVTFYEFPALYSEYNAMNVEQFRNEPWFRRADVKEHVVSAISLDQIISEGAPVPDIIKIDVEGSEDKVITGAETLLRGASPIIVMEFLSDGRHNEGHRRAAALLAASGYTPSAIDGDGGLISIDDIEAYLAGTGADSDNIVFSKTGKTA